MVAARAAAEFSGADDRTFQRCPGEANCDRFAAAAGTERQTKAANACTGCPLLPTKAREIEGYSAAEIEWMLAWVERVRQERDSGAGLDLNAIGAATWELVQLWDRIEMRCARLRAKEMWELWRVIVGLRQP